MSARAAGSDQTVDQIDVGEIVTAEGFDELDAGWTAIVERMELPSPFHSWSWNRAWWNHFGAGRRLRILLFSRRGRPIGIAQFFEQRYGLRGAGPRALFPIGWEDSSRKQGLTEQWELLFPPEDRAQLMMALSSWLKHNRWGAVLLPSLPVGYQPVPWMEAHAVAVAQPVSSFYRSLPDSWEGFVAGLKKSMRDNVKYYPRLLARRGHAVSFEIATSPEEVSRALPILFDLHRSRSLAATGIMHSDKFGDRDRRAFITAVSPVLARSAQIRIGILYVDQAAVAAQLWLEQLDTVFIHSSGYLPEWSDYSVGMVATLEAIKDAIGRGLSRVEFLRGEYHSKERWGTSRRSLAHLILGRQPKLQRLLLAPAPVRKLLHFEGSVYREGTLPGSESTPQLDGL
jgi:CelD/BcsL family acetyltransferase involved in cellulose biosynthesis